MEATSIEAAPNILTWIVLLLATNTGVILTLLRERLVFRLFREELERLLPPGYDPKRLDYPYIFDFTVPPAWREALAKHEQRMSVHPARDRWLIFRRIRNVLMVVEVLLIFAFAAWMVMG